MSDETVTIQNARATERCSPKEHQFIPIHVNQEKNRVRILALCQRCGIVFSSDITFSDPVKP